MSKLVLLIFMGLWATVLPAQQKTSIKNLVFEGAGIRGIAYCGAIRELEERGILSQAEKVCGTSAGAVTALTVSLGYSAKEIETIIATTNFKKFNAGNFFFAGGINRISKYFGWYRSKRVEKWLAGIIESKTGDPNITFEELHAKGYKDLYVTGTCLNQQKLILFSHNTYPKMRVQDAVRISMSIPLYFEAVFIDKAGIVARRPSKKEGLDVMVDGGFIGNFPIKVFDTAEVINNSTLGFRIDSDEQIKNDTGNKTLAPLPVGNLKQYMAAFYNMVIENLNRQPLSERDWQRTVSISDGKIGPRIRKLNAEEIETLIANGQRAAASYFK